MSAGFSTSDHRHHPHLMGKEKFLDFPHDFFYDFPSPYSTESESDDEDVAGLTRRFSRSASLHESLFNFKEKRVLSGSPESTLGWSDVTHSQAPSPPPFVKSDEEAWNLIYAAAGQVARMKMMMSMSNGTAEVVTKSSRGVVGAQRAFELPDRSLLGMSDGEEFFRQQKFCGNRGASAWPPPQLQNQRFQHHHHHHHHANQHKPCNAPVLKPFVPGGSGGGCTMPAKRECTGTGVFLPRRHRIIPPESRKRQACSSNLPAQMIQSSTKTFIPMTSPPQIQARINGGFVPHYEMLMGRRNAMTVAAQQQRRSDSIHGGVMESPANNPAMLLPREWTY